MVDWRFGIIWVEFFLAHHATIKTKRIKKKEKEKLINNRVVKRLYGCSVVGPSSLVISVSSKV